MIVPSRGRPDNIAALLDAWRDITTGDSRLLVAVDDDDPELERYLKLDTAGCRMYVGPRLRLGGTLNTLALKHSREHFAIGFMGDDHRPRGPVGWDVQFVTELRRLGTGLVYGDDLLQRERLPTAVAMTSNIIRTLGYMVPPGLTHLYMDDFWLTLGRKLGSITYLSGVVIEHMHPVAGKAQMDAGYAEVNAPEMYRKDGETFERWKRESLIVEVARLKTLMVR